MLNGDIPRDKYWPGILWLERRRLEHEIPVAQTTSPETCIPSRLPLEFGCRIMLHAKENPRCLGEQLAGLPHCTVFLEPRTMVYGVDNGILNPNPNLLKPSSQTLNP